MAVEDFIVTLLGTGVLLPQPSIDSAPAPWCKPALRHCYSIADAVPFSGYIS